MILEAIFNLIKSLVLFIIGLFPAMPDMSFLSQSLQSVIDILSSINSFVSVSLFAWCGFTIILFMNLEFIWSVIMWVIKKIPGVS